MPISDPVKKVSTETIPCGGSTQVSPSFAAAPGLCRDPADIVLVMDRSCSMDCCRMPQAKAAAKALLRTISQASQGQPGLTFGSGVRVGLVSFATTACVDAPLTDSLPQLEALIDGYTNDGWTGHADAFAKAASLLTDPSRRRVIVLFTDGKTNVGAPPASVAKAVRESGVEIFCVGLDVSPVELNTWASDPNDHHVFLAADADGLALAFREAGCWIVQAGGHKPVDLCPGAIPVTLAACQDSARVVLPAVRLDGLGRNLQLDVTIRDVCPNRRVAVAVTLNELDVRGCEHPRGMKTFLIPAQEGNCCRDVTLRCVSFVLPEVLDVSGGCPDSLCNPRNFNVRVLANYVDTDFVCCPPAAPWVQ